jgi:hypothetical protein
VDQGENPWPHRQLVHIKHHQIEKAGLLSVRLITISDHIDFANEVRNRSIREGDILVSYDVSSLFTSIPLDETIHILPIKLLKITG